MMIGRNGGGRGTRKTRERSALDRVGISIEYDEDTGMTVGDEVVMYGLDDLADTLNERTHLGLRAPPLDRVLAEMGADEHLVDMSADLIERIGRAAYDGGLSREGAEEAEERRSELYDALDVFLTGLEGGDHA